MIGINLQHQKKIAIYVEDAEARGMYPIRRALTIAQALPSTIELVFLGDSSYQSMIPNFPFFPIQTRRELRTSLEKIAVDLLIRDSGNTYQEEVAQLQEIVPSLIHFDDFGPGNTRCQFVIQTLYSEQYDPPNDRVIVGPDSFIVDQVLENYQRIGAAKKVMGSPPHLVVTFGEQDEGNLSFRALRHLLHLQIPLQITLVVGRGYKHNLADLQMMALRRRHTTIVQATDHSFDLFSTADIILCSSAYLPYEIAVMGIPCIVLAQNEFEASLDFPSPAHGFTHLGLGRKVKQSNLLNAIMEYLLHDDLRRQAVDQQLQLNLGEGLEKVQEAILYSLAYPLSLPK